MLPVCTPPLEIAGKPSVRVDVWNEGDILEFVSGSEKWIEIGGTGAGAFSVEVSMPDWIRITAADANWRVW